MLELDPRRSREIGVGDAEETLFVLERQRHGRGRRRGHRARARGRPLPAARIDVRARNPGPETLRVVAVRVPNPAARGRDDPPAGASAGWPTRRLEAATTQREFRIVADPRNGLRSATHFVGYIPTARAPDHFHTYDEVIYVLDGEGVMHAGEFEQPLAPGSCIQLPARTVHCLENTGTEPMRVVAVFRPAGSPAAAYYPDGTPAYCRRPAHAGACSPTLQRRSDNQ